MIKLRQQTAEQSHEVTSEVTATTTAAAAAAEEIRAERDAALNEVATLQQSMSALKEVCAI